MARTIFGITAFTGAVMALGFVGNMDVRFGNEDANFIGALISLFVSFVSCKLGKIGGIYG